MSDYKPSRGVITRVALRDGEGVLNEGVGHVEGVAADIFYEVTIDNPHSAPTAYWWVAPAHRRISDVIAIKSARVGDECVVNWSGNEPRFLIFEGFVDPFECDTQAQALSMPPPQVVSREVDRSALEGEQ